MLGNLGNTSPVPPALEVNPSDCDATGVVDLETPEEDDDALYELPPMVVFQELLVEWAVQIAEGLAELHSHSIVWADPHFRNILVTADLNIVLCDFAFSLSSPPQFLQFSTRPPQIFVAPFGFFGYDPTYVDIFGYGVMLFALLANRFPWTHDLVPCYELHLAATEKHDRFEFDSLNNTELEAHFSSVINKCFLATYTTGMELLDGVKNARDNWLRLLLLSTTALSLAPIMCWSDAFVRYYTCGATTGQLSPLDLGPVGVAAASTKSPRICTNRRQAQAEFAAYNRRWEQLRDEYWQRAQLWSQRTGQPINHYQEPRPAALKRFDVWLGANVPYPTGHINACTQVHQPHKYPHAPGTIPVGWHSIHHPRHL
ncbi:kinase-like domain-containing protein [Mycena metata]|uniref:non-specific serine/threonine protein kinase n=1 Tax=Mycena metata TaxID=1033252 RepID=A0AAD7MKB4_9AGAR|nr:kinase-like domain-containing protein [Mycena metata]